jgi:hypothetical protein
VQGGDIAHLSDGEIHQRLLGAAWAIYEAGYAEGVDVMRAVHEANAAGSLPHVGAAVSGSPPGQQKSNNGG